MNTMKLTESQLEAIDSKARFLAITAGAGGGKTRVLVERVARLIEKKEASLDDILAITFTEKAALQLKQRLATSVSDEIAISAAAIGTFHSFCARIIRDDAPLLGIDPDFMVLEEQTAGLLLRKAVKETLLKMLDDKDKDAWLLIEELDFRDAVALLEELIGYRWHTQKISNLRSEISVREAGLFDATMKCFGRADKRYAELKGPNLDFADLEMFAIRLLQDKDTRKKYQKRFKHILVDEFQDVNDTQGHLISLLFNKEVNNLTIVGDEKQSIYRFRGANVEEFKKALRSAEQTVTLKENFRSTAAILEFINSVFPRFAPLITPPSPIPSTSLETCKVETPMLDEPEDATSDERRVSEANFIAMTVESLEGSTACLFSSLKSSKIYLKALEEGQISYDIVGGCGFLEKEEITDVLNALRLTADEKDIMALLGLARSPYIGLTDEELFMLCRNRPKGEGLYQAIRGHSKGGFLNVIEEASNGLSIAEMIRRYAGDNSTDDIEKLCHMADDAASREKISLKDFVEYLAALKERGAAIPEFPQTVESQAVLMTIHQAKGLEFDNVILCDTIRRNRNDSKKWCFIRGENPGLAFKLRPENNPEADPIETENYTRLFELNEEDNKKERERLLYVAMTRAKKRLIIPLHPGAKQDGEWHKMLLNICHPHGCKRLPASCVAGVSQEHSSRDSRLLPRE